MKFFNSSCVFYTLRVALVLCWLLLCAEYTTACTPCSVASSSTSHCFKSIEIANNAKVAFSPGKTITSMALTVVQDYNHCSFKVLTMTESNYISYKGGGGYSTIGALTQTSDVNCHNIGSTGLGSDKYWVVVDPQNGVGECRVSVSMTVSSGGGQKWVSGDC